MRRERFGKLGGIRQWVEPVFDHETTISLSKSTANERPPESIQGSPPDSSPAPPASGTTGLSKAPNHLDSIIQAVNLTFTAFPYRRHDRFHLSGNGNHWEAYPTGPCGFDTRQGDFPGIAVAARSLTSEPSGRPLEGSPSAPAKVELFALLHALLPVCLVPETA